MIYKLIFILLYKRLYNKMLEWKGNMQHKKYYTNNIRQKLTVLTFKDLVIKFQKLLKIFLNIKT